MEDVIGTTAGQIYKILNAKGEHTTATLKKELVLDDPNLLPMALGWLAREGKLTITKKGKSIVVALVTADLATS